MTNLFKPKLPTPEPPTPLPDEEQLGKARKREVRKATQSGGYQSTILSTAGGKETLGA